MFEALIISIHDYFSQGWVSDIMNYSPSTTQPGIYAALFGGCLKFRVTAFAPPWARTFKLYLPFSEYAVKYLE